MNNSKRKLNDRSLLLSQALWKVDPMNTCCHGNSGMEGEYDGEAMMLDELIGKGLSVPDSIKQTFDYYFWADCLKPNVNKKLIKAVLLVINSCEYR